MYEFAQLGIQKGDREVTYDEVENKVKQLVQRPLEITNVRWFSSYKVHTRRAEKFSKGRFHGSP